MEFKVFGYASIDQAYGGFKNQESSTEHWSIDAGRGIPALLKAYELTEDLDYLNAAKLAGGTFLYTMQQDPVTLGVHDKYYRSIVEVDQMIKNGVRGYKSRAEFIKEAIRKRCEELATKTPVEMPVLEHFNISEQGVRILDRSLQSKTSKGRIIDVYFKPDNAWCDYCESSNCNHVRFALNLPEVHETLKKKGWKIK